MRRVSDAKIKIARIDNIVERIRFRLILSFEFSNPTLLFYPLEHEPHHVDSKRIVCVRE